MSNLITIAMTIGLSSWLFMGGEEGEGIKMPEVPSLTKAVASVTGSKEPKAESNTPLDKLSNFALLRHFAKVYDVPAALPQAICKRESFGCAHWHNGGVTTSHANAQGMMQIIPSTFALYKRHDGKITNRIDNAEAGVRYLKKLHIQYAGNITLISAAYNSGENAVAKYHNHVPPYSETREYVRKVTQYYTEFSKNPT